MLTRISIKEIAKVPEAEFMLRADGSESADLYLGASAYRYDHETHCSSKKQPRDYQTDCVLKGAVETHRFTSKDTVKTGLFRRPKPKVEMTLSHELSLTFFGAGAEPYEAERHTKLSYHNREIGVELTHVAQYGKFDTLGPVASPRAVHGPPDDPYMANDAVKSA